MALITCTECGRQISSRAKSCPKCGYPPAAENQPVAAHPRIPAGDGAQVARTAKSEAAATGTAAKTGAEQPEVPAQSQQEAPAQEWYYVTAAGRNGPVTRECLHQLVAAGEISDQTSVWQVGMPDWVALSLHQQTAQEPVPTAPPVACRPASQWYLWVLALAPLWGALLQVIVTEAWVALTHKHLGYYSQFWWIMVLANLTAAALDYLALKSSGEDVTGIGKGTFLLVPLYLYLRRKRPTARLLRLGVWAGSLLLALSGSFYLNGLYARLSTL